MRRSGWGLLTCALLAGATLSPAAALISPSPALAEAHAATPALSERSLLTRLTRPSGWLTPLPMGTSVSQISSHDLSGGNVDGGSYLPQLAPVLPPTYVRKTDGGFVLADERGPGCLVRIWMTGTSPESGGTGSFKNLQLFFDGKPKPAVDVPALAFFAGRDPRFPRPLVNDYAHSSGGNYSYVPFCFAHRLEVHVTGDLTVPLSYFQLTFLKAPHGTPVETFTDGRRAARTAATALASTGRAPSAKPAFTTSRRLHAGDRLTVARLHGPATVRYLRFTVRPFDITTLSSLTFRARADGSRRPQVDLPLAAMFGDGIEVRPIRSAGFGMDPRTRTGYLALPMPFRRTAQLSVKSTGTTASVSVRGWTGPTAPTATHLYGEQRVTRTQVGRDFPILNTAGSGQLASLVLDVRDPMPLSGDSPGQWFLEGDERVYVDGLRSPSIYGTGTEDEFNGGFYYNHGAFSLPLNGAGPLGTVGALDGGTQSSYRVFGDDGVRWSRRIDYGQQNGGNDERLPATVTATTFSYRGPRTLTPADQVRLGDATSRRRHHVTGQQLTPTSLSAYFEGDRDGTIPASVIVIGGTYYASPPPELSPEGFRAGGVAFRGPMSLRLRIPADNRGIILRRLQDQQSSVPVTVTIDGRPAGVWQGGAFQGNPLKRWLESDFAVPARLTTGKSAITVTLRPLHSGETATAFVLQAFTFRPGGRH
jgi:hypothetical protein